jgi:hypothetical protein
MTRHTSKDESNTHRDPLEDQLRNLDAPKLPTSWKQDILNHARKQEIAPNPKPTHNQIQKQNTEPGFNIVTTLIRNTFAKLTPVQISMGVIWGFVLFGGQLDKWLNKTDAANIHGYHTHNLSESFAQQMKSWEMAGLDLQHSFEEDEKNPPPKNQHKSKPPGPRSSLKTENTINPRPVAMGRPRHINLVASIHSKQATLETHYSFKRTLPQLPVRHGSGTIRSTIATATHTI